MITSIRARILAAGVIAALCSLAANAATITTIEKARTHTTTGAIGACTISGATNATPIVVTCGGAHGLVDGDGVFVASVGGNTNANGTFFAKVTGYSTTTFALYSDAALATGVAGNSAYTSGGTAIKALDVSAVTGDFTLVGRLESMTAGKMITVSIQESADGFSSDVRTLAIWHLLSPTSNAPRVFSIRSRDIPTERFGTANVKCRLLVQDITSATTAVFSLYLEQ